MRVWSVLCLIFLVAGCASHTRQGTPTSSGASSVSTLSQTPPTTPTTSSAPAPGPGASVESVTRWIEAGDPVDPEEFRTVDQDGVPSQLSDGEVAFREPGDLGPRVIGGCITAFKYKAPLSCLPGIRNAPPRPRDLPGEWIAGWVNFDGASVTLGSLHGDPGPFTAGVGLPLEYGKRLKFADYQCRSDAKGLYCVNYPHHSAVRLGDELVVFGCTKRAIPPRGIGVQYDCG
ncbi:hypothetical protein BST43_06770 [Mycobacteroides saopaulense]|uniref:LppI n=1 Tax=Mycobacteroides saopaulense TaxID=1578165 RepID=A0A1X0JA88_9MYCO|nr:hypothetical protein [Mycobacteroides saopaulense]ORB59684.1 hypothetical protein BST43_06770 [Mycobacteroides saopaulense]